MTSIPKICSIENCEKPTVGRGWCSRHWKHWRRHGDPLKNKLEMHGMGSQLHGVAPEYRCWTAMKSRCYNPNNNRYARYGGRGIEVCEQWRNSFLAFYRDMGNKPDKTYSIERRNANGNYEPENCIWATQDVQSNNTSTSRYISFNGETRTQHQWALIIGISEKTIHARLKKGFTIEEALTLSLRPRRLKPFRP